MNNNTLREPVIYSFSLRLARKGEVTDIASGVGQNDLGRMNFVDVVEAGPVIRTGQHFWFRLASRRWCMLIEVFLESLDTAFEALDVIHQLRILLSDE